MRQYWAHRVGALLNGRGMQHPYLRPLGNSVTLPFSSIWIITNSRIGSHLSSAEGCSATLNTLKLFINIWIIGVY